MAFAHVATIVAGVVSTAILCAEAQARDQATATMIRLDCAAFRQNTNGTWTVTTETFVYVGLDDTHKAPNWMPLISGLTLGRNQFLIRGVDLAELLEQRCEPKQ